MLERTIAGTIINVSGEPLAHAVFYIYPAKQVVSGNELSTARPIRVETNELGAYNFSLVVYGDLDETPIRYIFERNKETFAFDVVSGPPTSLGALLEGEDPFID